MTLLLRFVSIAIFVIAVSAVVTGVSAQNALQSVVSTDLVRAELMAYVPQGVGPDKTVWVGLQLKHQPGWHTYWKNSGDSGQPTSLTWTLPPGVAAGDIAWPLPQKIPIGSLANYGYDGTVLLPVPLTITPDFNPSLPSPTLDIKLHATWLVCRQECVPQEGEFALQVAVNGSTAINAADFEAAFQATPKAFDGQSSMTLQNNSLLLSVTGLPDAWHGKTLDAFPETPEVIETAAPSTQAWQGTTWTSTILLSAQRLASPDTMTWVLAADVDGHRQGTTARVTGDWSAQQALTVALPTSAAVLSAPPIGFWAALAGALLGGMLLNLMPCVFPVLAIKVLSFTRHANDHSGHRISGLAYSAGVTLSFVALGAVMLVLRSGGEQLGWGFQLQSPAVVAALAALFTVMGLNLAGLFEFGQFVPGKVALLEAKNPAIDAFMSGILAVLIASPCTAPFMGASLGLALGLPASHALLVFATMGLGMALPYLAASLSPSLARRLPRPGAWMVTFRQAMAFPMFATVVWLVWVLGQQSGIHGAMALLTLLLGLSMVIWALTLPGRSGKLIALFSIALFAALTGVAGQYVIKDSGSVAFRSDSNRWQPWSPGKVEQWLSGGRPVFVDFTAAWCVTCQYNEQTTLSHAGVLADFDAKKVVLLRADWTRRDPAITAALSQLGRNGVPLYVLYQPGQTPVVLSEILTVDKVRSLLRQI